MIGRSGERGSGISVLAARHDDDDDCLKNFDSNEFYSLTELNMLCCARIWK